MWDNLLSTSLTSSGEEWSGYCAKQFSLTQGCVRTILWVCACLFCCKRCIDSNHNEQIIDSDGLKSIWRHLHSFSRATSNLLSFLVLRSHWNFVWHLIVVVCCAGSYLLYRTCRQQQTCHHRYRNLTKQGCQYRTGCRWLRLVTKIPFL